MGPSAWVPVLQLSERAGTWIGVRGDEWQVARSVDGPGEPVVGRPIAAWPLLEQDPVALESAITAILGGEGGPRGFPFGQLLASAMRSGMDYWASLALDWADAIGVDADVEAAADDLREASWASQRTRQRARRIARRQGGGAR